jgi:hypothetical protein
MRILRSIVTPSTAFMAFCDSKITGRSPIRSEVICDELVWDKAIFLQKLAHEFQRGALVPFRLDQHIEDLALGVDGSPQIDHAAIDFQIDLVEMPDGMGLRPAFTQVSRDHGSKMVHPAANGLIGDHDPALGKQILDIPEAHGEPDIKPDRLLDDFGREAVAAIADLGHRLWLRLKVTDGKPNDDVTMPFRLSSDSLATGCSTSHSATVPNKPRLGCRSSIITKFNVPQHGIYSIALYLWTYLSELKLTDGPTLMGTNLCTAHHAALSTTDSIGNVFNVLSADQESEEG